MKPSEIIGRLLAVCVLTALLTSCVSQRPQIPAGSACNAANFSVVDGFAGARRGPCTITGANSVRLDILREDDRVSNPSPWYAFKLTPNKPGAAKIVLDYQTWEHRYVPKISSDGNTWRPLDSNLVEISANPHRATLHVQLTNEPVWIAAQELITPAIHNAWNQEIAEQYNVSLSELGESRRNHPIAMFASNPEARDVLLLIGRQHPPEVSGAFAFYSFIETLFENSDLAKTFRQHFRVIAIPLLNPDGVISGNWRHNAGAVDLNRDWGPFTQPETKLIANLLDDLDRNGHRIRLFIDFHSTTRNLSYTQDDSSITDPPDFAHTWLRNAQSRLGNYSFTDEAGPISDTANGKNYMYKRYGIPAITFEVGDETDRGVARDAARVFAEELMRLMLGQDRCARECIGPDND